MPAAQSSHAADPVTVLYFPVVQKVHGPPSGPAQPALQVHAVKALLPAGDMDRDAQLVQLASPVFAYWPATQLVHVELSMAPTVDEDLPAAQFTHVPSPFI